LQEKKLGDLPKGFEKRDDHNGGYKVAVDYAYLAKLLSGRTSTGAARYLECCRSDSKADLVSNETVLVSWSKLEENLLMWDSFVRDCPDMVSALENSGPWYLIRRDTQLCVYYLAGTENSPVYDSKTNMLKSDIRNVFKAFIADKDNESALCYRSVQLAYTLFEGTGFERNEKALGMVKMLPLVAAKENR
jgi:hypothetical protein